MIFCSKVKVNEIMYNRSAVLIYSYRYQHHHHKFDQLYFKQSTKHTFYGLVSKIPQKKADSKYRSGLSAGLSSSDEFHLGY